MAKKFIFFLYVKIKWTKRSSHHCHNIKTAENGIIIKINMNTNETKIDQILIRENAFSIPTEAIYSFYRLDSYKSCDVNHC